MHQTSLLFGSGMHPYFFGFGSLVNTATHSYGDPRPAHLAGWRRCWVESRAHDAVFLSAEPCAGSAIQGLVAAVPNADWQALDLREFAYERVDISQTVTHDMSPRPDVSLYAVPEAAQAPGADAQPIRLSYLDVVLQGYLRVFGPEGAEQFMQTTTGWARPLLDDRANPSYPRHQTLTGAERDIVDQLLNTVSLRP